MLKKPRDKKNGLRPRSVVRATNSLLIWTLALAATVLLQLAPPRPTSTYISDSASILSSSSPADQESVSVGDPSYVTANKEEYAMPTQQSPYGGAFVHIGKTGGSTVSVELRNGCHSYRPHPCRNITNETIVSRLVQSYYHVPDFGLLPRSSHDFYLVSTRDPLDRVMSSFVYEHYANRRARQESMDPLKVEKMQDAYSCFPTLEKFVGYLDSDDPTSFNYPFAQKEVKNDSCQDLARAALFGKVRVYGHLFFGYERIRSFLMATSLAQQQRLAIYATRQEHLQGDWEGVNRHLGQVENVGRLPHQRSGLGAVQTMPVQNRLSRRGRRLLCNALKREYAAYLWFLQRASNLTPQDVRESIQYSISQCPQLTRLLLQDQ